MKFTRKQNIAQNISPKRVLLIYGPRRVGKTTLLQDYLATHEDQNPLQKILFVTGDDASVREIFASQQLAKLKKFAKDYDVIAIDEAQNVPSIGLGLKMIVDHYPEKNIIATGSSSFEIANQIGEPLTGRHFTMTLFPLAQKEIHLGSFERYENIEDALIYGSYPEILTTSSYAQKERILNELVSSYLYKDILALDKIKSPALLRKIAKIIATQIGHEVSLNEIANTLDADVKTVARYLDLLEKMFIIKKVPGFSRNLRNEITKKARYYFLDNGVRNAVLEQFQPLDSRPDHGALWENFVFMELAKYDNLCENFGTYYFWRTHTGVEIDIIREINGQVTAYECKWNPRKAKNNPPKTFVNAYPEASFFTITPDNYEKFIGLE